MARSERVRISRERLLPRSDIEALIAKGSKLVIVDGRVLLTNAWLPYHPGGDKAILHMVGRDGTNEVKAFHSSETQQFMLKYQIGRIDGQWKDFLPPIQGGIFRTTDEQRASPSGIFETPSVEQEAFSEQDSSEEPSPIFEPADLAEHHLRHRRGSTGVASDSSATSLSDLELDGEAALPEKPDTGELRTQQELQHDLDLYPSLDPVTQAEIIIKYKQLDRRVRDEKLYDCNYSAYAIELLRYTFLALSSLYLLRAQHFALSALFLGLLWHQLVFTVHDAGHMGITHNFHIDSCISIFVADFLGGLSACWWKHNHNVHHIVTNSAEHDPDIQHMPFFAISHRFFDSLRSTYYDRIMTYDPVAKFMLKYQHYMYYPILTFGRFNLYVLSWQYILFGIGPRKGPAWWHRYLEMAGQIFFWYWFGYLVIYKSIPDGWNRFIYVMISHAVTMPVHVQITLSHFAMSTADLGVAESFPQRMLRTTMDVDCPPWLDFVHGGLQFQAVHHLFPRMPRHNLRRAQKLVMGFCEDVGIPYALYGFVEGNEKVIGRLGEVAKQARILAECQRSITVKNVLDGH
ncbi:hypothetical protein BAUCODRAFT_34682 [Baudoinia panamericana UAMH 10762]|uniref:Delta 8-(E)-sphingolipid desaturase n=1 Tax=Baudoinia panamericana (strain UAMH 10762) TaxID=717646 RepID=M2NAQ6_BAUPA|nr:uncharacterized protein BAUCODRAFT_34682 [Baudoinia panamericana UAMH 10762]EMC95925.1 hypothetical protein BAUCODRAFT_34682 [Baudoinia panamericana UAMH 10762]